jgi:glutaredoxin
MTMELVTWQKDTTAAKKKVEIFIAGCPFCERTINLVMRLVNSSHEVVISDVHRPEVASKAEQYGIRTVPAVVIDGKLTACCAGRGCDEHVLRSALGV